MIKGLLTKLYNFIDNNYHLKGIVNLINKHNFEIIFDVGAHKGEFSSAIIKKCPNIKEIYAFEPQKNIYKFLKNSFKNNKKINSYNYALSNISENKELKINEISTTSTFSDINYNSLWFKLKNLTVLKKDSFLVTVLAKVITLDKFVSSKKINKIDLLKIDTEGHELDVLLGCKYLFDNKIIKNILIEIEPNVIMYRNYNPKIIHEKLLLNGFILIKTFSFPLHRVEDRFYSLVKQ